MYQTTRWSLVRRAGRAHPDSRVALEELCRIYRPAVLAYLRRVGMDREAAEERAQSFFLYLLERDLPARADPSRGRFRMFLRAALRNHVSHERERELAQRRAAPGGVLELDGDHEPADDARGGPEHAFDLAFALTVLGRAMDRLQADVAERGQTAEFALLRPALTEGLDAGELEDLARRLGARPNTVSARLARLRRRLRTAVREELADIVAEVRDVDAELLHLRSLLGGREPE